MVILGWIVVSVVIIATAPKLSATSDQSEFLPGKYESIRAANLQSDAFPQQSAVGAILVFDRQDGKALTASDSADVQKIVTGLQPKLDPVFAGITAQAPSQNKLVQIAVVGIAKDKNPYDPDALDAAKQLRVDGQALVKGTDLRLGITGAAAQALDSQDASKNAEAIVGIATVLLILILMILIFRSAILAVLPILVIGLVSQVAVGLIGVANKIFDLKTDSSIQVILIVVLFGIGTDYILFFLFRYRERLRTGEDSRTSVAQAVTRAGEAIASAGGAVIVAFMALVLSSLGIFKSIGPALAIAVAVTVVAALTLVPAIVSLLGTKVFWPSKSWRVEPKGARFAALGDSLGRRPGRYAVASGLVLAVLAIFALGFNPNFDLGDSGRAQERRVRGRPAHPPGGPPGRCHRPDHRAAARHRRTAAHPGRAHDVRRGPGQGAGRRLGLAGAPSATTRRPRPSASYSRRTRPPTRPWPTSRDRSATRRTRRRPEGTEALVGGTTSVFVDFQKAMNRDYRVVFPVAALVIMLILALLLRSLVAPLYLMASVGLGFGATLGAAVLVFQHLGGREGLIFLLPIYIYLFVVALGTDYNILMIARLREEAREGLDSHRAAAEALKHAGPTVAAAGLILAGTFASLMLGGNALLTALGFSISFGIFVAAFVMAMFFTPSLTALIGHAAWWPGHGDETVEH